MVQHLARGMERFWFRAIAAGDPVAIDQVVNHPTNDWVVDANVSAQELFDLYRQEAELTNAFIAATPLDTAPAWWPEYIFGNWRLPDLRHIIFHTLTETACHTGHLDAARELIDGKQWMVMD